MADPIYFPTVNQVMKPPDGMESDCVPLPVYRDEHGFVSLWQFTFRERMQILLFGRLWVTVLGFAHPPIGMTPDRLDLTPVTKYIHFKSLVWGSIVLAAALIWAWIIIYVRDKI